MYTSYLNGDTEFTDPEAYTKSIQDVMDQIAKIAPEGFTPVEIFKLFEGTGKDPVKEVQDAVTKADNIIKQIGGDETKTKQVIFETTGMDMTQAEVDAYNALGPGESKSFVTSFIIASAKLELGEMPKQEDFPRPGSFNIAMKEYTAQVEKAKELAKTIQGINQSQTPSNQDGSGGKGSSSGSKNMTKKGAKKWLKDSNKEIKALNEYSGAVAKVVDGTNAEAISMIPQDV
jgi:hypothetical protein